MSIQETTDLQEQDETQIILDALREIQSNPELQADAEKDPQSLLSRLGLSEIARSAVTLGITAVIATSAVQGQLPVTRPAWWG